MSDVNKHDPSHRENVLSAIRSERNRQEHMWEHVDDVHTLGMWFTVLVARYGKLADAAFDQNDSVTGLRPAEIPPEKAQELRYRAVQVAAVVTALLEQLNTET